ncbi:MAG: hypothetical protein NT130_03445 [Candidatus Micrarchaeota archaeon]|nr:hypothetical protein [Candidatus Micrarchaeota archaeon]
MPGIGDFKAYMMIVGYISIFGAIILFILSSIKTTLNSADIRVNQALDNGTAAILTMFVWLGIITLVFAAAVVLDVLLGGYIGGGSGGGRGRKE